ARSMRAWAAWTVPLPKDEASAPVSAVCRPIVMVCVPPWPAELAPPGELELEHAADAPTVARTASAAIVRFVRKTTDVSFSWLHKCMQICLHASTVISPRRCGQHHNAKLLPESALLVEGLATRPRG